MLLTNLKPVGRGLDPSQGRVVEALCVTKQGSLTVCPVKTNSVRAAWPNLLHDCVAVCLQVQPAVCLTALKEQRRTTASVSCCCCRRRGAALDLAATHIFRQMLCHASKCAPAVHGEPAHVKLRETTSSFACPVIACAFTSYCLPSFCEAQNTQLMNTAVHTPCIGGIKSGVQVYMSLSSDCNTCQEADPACSFCC